MEENKEEFKSCDCSNDKWIKFALILAAIFLGCYLATYYLLDQMRHTYYTPLGPIPNIDNVIKEQNKMLHDFDAVPLDMSTMLPTNLPIVQTFRKDDAYKIVIDLKPFDNNVNNLKIKVKPNRISITGGKLSDSKNSESSYEFSQSFSLPEEVDPAKVTKEINKGKYIVTLPIVDND